MFQRLRHLRGDNWAGAIKCSGALSSHCRGVNLLKMVPPARGYDLTDYYQPLCGGRMVQPAGMMSSVPCREPVVGPSRHHGASCNDHLASKGPKASPGGWLRGVGGKQRRGGEGGGRMEDREWRGYQFLEEEEEGDTRRVEAGTGGGDKLDFWSRLTTHNSPYKTSLPVCTRQTRRLVYWHGSMLHQGHTYHKTMTGYSKQNRKVKMGGRGVGGWEMGGGGGSGWRWASMSDHVGDGTWTITFAPWIFQQCPHCFMHHLTKPQYNIVTTKAL